MALKANLRPTYARISGQLCRRMGPAEVSELESLPRVPRPTSCPRPRGAQTRTSPFWFQPSLFILLIQFSAIAAAQQDAHGAQGLPQKRCVAFSRGGQTMQAALTLALHLFLTVSCFGFARSRRVSALQRRGCLPLGQHRFHLGAYVHSALKGQPRKRSDMHRARAFISRAPSYCAGPAQILPTPTSRSQITSRASSAAPVLTR